MHKGISAITENPLIFADPHATDELGVGRNMVNAIRYWLVASGLATETKETIDNRPKPKLNLSELGEIVSKYDPYFEEDLTLWIIHYNLVSNSVRSTTWYWLFNKYPMTSFDSQTCLNYLTRWIAQQKTKRKIATPSLQKDINCLVRTYTPPVLKNKKATPEDTFESPLASLRLLEFMENTASYKLNVGKRLLPTAAMAYAVMRYLEKQGDEITEAGFQELLSSEFSPGRAFLLSSDGLLENLDALQEDYGKKRFTYSRTAGMNVLRVEREPIKDLLEEAYEELEEQK
jgi:hypothetical protein